MKLFSCVFASALGHGRILEPPGRSSYRLLTDDPNIDQSLVVPNWNDNQLFCGGFQTQVSNGYKCGICGDDYTQPRPRDNEWNGRFGSSGIIPRTFEQGDVIDLHLDITAHHQGFFEFKICKMELSHFTENAACFDSDDSIMTLEDGNQQWDVTGGSTGHYYGKVRLPEDLSCDHCVIQWRYHAGNTWACDENGNCGTGVGPQEEFYGCSDISIRPKFTTTTTTTRSSTRPTTTQTTKTHFTTTTLKETTSSPSHELENFCLDKANGFYSHPESCYMYIDCYNGNAVIKSCPTGLAWNSDKNYCDREQNVPACFI